MLTSQYKTPRSSPYSDTNNRSLTQDISAFYGTGSSLLALVNTLSWSDSVLPAHRTAVGPSSPCKCCSQSERPAHSRLRIKNCYALFVSRTHATYPDQLILHYFMILMIPVQLKAYKLCSASSTIVLLLPPVSVHTSSDTLSLLQIIILWVETSMQFRT